MAKFGKVFAFLSLHLPYDGCLEILLRNGCYEKFVHLFFNSHAVGIAVVLPLGFEIAFVRNPISESSA